MLERKAAAGASSLLPIVDDDAGLEAYGEALDASRKRTDGKRSAKEPYEEEKKTGACEQLEAIQLTESSQKKLVVPSSEASEKFVMQLSDSMTKKRVN